MPSEAVFAVCEPTPLGIHDLDMILQLGEKIGIKHRYVVVNRTDLDPSGISKVEDIASTAGAEIIAKIPYSKEIVMSYVSGQPYTILKSSDSTIMEEFRRIVEVIS